MGPELAGVLVEVCCYLNGIEAAEKKFGWPRRSGKTVLQIALSTLARHYGLLRAPRYGGKNEHRGTDGYRPAMFAPTIGPD